MDTLTLPTQATLYTIRNAFSAGQDAFDTGIPCIPGKDGYHMDCVAERKLKPSQNDCLHAEWVMGWRAADDAHADGFEQGLAKKPNMRHMYASETQQARYQRGYDLGAQTAEEGDEMRARQPAQAYD